MSARAAWPALGTTAVVAVAQPERLAPARAAVERELAAIDRACSRFRDDSDLARVNAGAGRPVKVSPLLLEVLGVALRAARLTGGAVDPTVGAALIHAGYDRDFAQLRGSAEPLAPFRVPGWRVLRIDPADTTVRVPAGVILDVGATAKAFAADRAALAASEAVGGGVLVSLGGDVATAGRAPGGGWRVQVADSHAAPLPDQTITISDGGLATSSTAVRRWRRGEETAHHILDPATGKPAGGPWRTVSVAAASCVAANTASTAAVVLGAGAPAWLERCGLPARLCGHDGSVIRVAGWPV